MIALELDCEVYEYIFAVLSFGFGTTTSVVRDSVQDAPSGKAETPWKFVVSASTFDPAKFILHQPL